MLNAVNRFIIAALATVVVVSCGDKNKDEAIQLCNRAETEVKSGNYEAAVNLLDTLDNRYASQVEVRRSAMKFRAMAVEGLTLRRISAVDDTLAYLSQKLEAYNSQFEYISNPGENLGGNYVAKTLAKSKFDILPRINDDGYFTLSVTIPGKSIGFSRIEFVDGDQFCSTSPVSPSRLVKVENSEMTVLQQEDVADAIDWLCDHKSANAYRLIGEKSAVSQKLSPALSDAIVSTWHYALDKQSYRLALIEREKLERKLQLCRDQLANMIDR